MAKTRSPRRTRHGAAPEPPAAETAIVSTAQPRTDGAEALRLGSMDFAVLMSPPAGRTQALQGFDAGYTDIVNYIVKCTHNIWEEMGMGLIETHYLHNAKIHTGDGWFLGAEMQGTSAAATTAGCFPNYTLDGRIGGHAIANATLRYAPSGQPWELRLGAYNLFDRRYGEPAPPDPYAEAIFLTAQARQAYPGAGRTLRLDGVFHF